MINLLPSAETLGRVHSIETCGAVDGPGLRFVVFMQGCLLKCHYCHNRDTWDLKGGKERTATSILDEMRGYQHFLIPSGGGITITGGEALLQKEFVLEVFTKAKQEGFHTCLDTNGFLKKHTHVIDELMDVTDLVLLDLKHLDDEVHKELTGVHNDHILNFAHYLNEQNKPTWIRHVILPGYTNNDVSSHLLGSFLQPMTNIEKVDLIAYHKLGVHKWHEMNVPYPLEDTQPPSAEDMIKAGEILKSYGLTITLS